MKVIVAGLAKTGTKTMNAALTQLGYKVYDVEENFVLLFEDYKKIVYKGWTTEDFRRMYENVDATVDLPACYFWEEIHKAFPEAKIILTVRDNDDVWFKSFRNNLVREDSVLTYWLLQILSPTLSNIVDILNYPMYPLVYGFVRTKWNRQKPTNGDLVKKKYRAHNANVMHNAPPDKLLVFNCKEGWGPLCEFLKVPVPDGPFPHRNVGGKWVDKTLKDNPIMQRMKREALVVSLAFLAFGVAAGYFLYKKVLK